MAQPFPPPIITTQEPSGAWRVQIHRPCKHTTRSPARFERESSALAHGSALLAAGCLSCRVEQIRAA